MWYTFFFTLSCSYLTILLIGSTFFFKGSKSKVFLYYSLYCLFLLLYLFSKGTFFDNVFGKYSETTFFKTTNWYIQIIFYNIYVFFGIHYVGLYKNISIATKKTILYTSFSITLLSTLLFILAQVNILSAEGYEKYFTFFFLPIYLILVFYLLYLILFRNKSRIKYYFLTGSFFYILFALTAFLYSIADKKIGTLDPLILFFIAVIIECTFFTIGLTTKVQKVYKDRLKFHTELVKTQNTLNKSLRSKLNEQKQLNDLLIAEKEKQRLETQVAILQNKALRSQMNSHLVFNVLNAIKLYILEKNNEEAVKYLGFFAKFIRNVLDGSINETITLKEEINIIENYLKVEQIRFENDLIFEIIIPNTINLEDYVIPSLFLQPFVENAIWQGLKSIKGEKKITVKIIKKNDIICISIDDNGIGYYPENKKKDNEHKSYGLSITKDRAIQFNKDKNTTLSFTIKNKKDFSDESGTLVEVFL
ncbi:MAG TPA: histidine kinase [Edaphocola sp.]|nr:histidine kinase [Edaphocola sp.]